MLKPQINVSVFGKSAKKATDDTSSEPAVEIDWDKIGKITQETSQKLAKVVAIAYVGKKLIDTACEISVIAATNKF
jgi:hypothetical protein